MDKVHEFREQLESLEQLKASLKDALQDAARDMSEAFDGDTVYWNDQPRIILRLPDFKRGKDYYTIVAADRGDIPPELVDHGSYVKSMNELREYMTVHGYTTVKLDSEE